MAEYVIKRRNGDLHTMIFDDEDAPRVLAMGRWSYHPSGYAYYQAPGHPRVYIHRFILGLEKGDGLIADHVNGAKLDNRRSNLTVVTGSRNNSNQKIMNGRGTSRYRGVHWDKARDRWSADVKIDKRKYHLGRFRAEKDALAAVVAFRREHGLRGY